MDNKAFGITFSSILASSVVFFGAANAGAFAVDTWLFPTEEFGDNTYIGTTDVSNMEVAEAKLLFGGQVDSWRQGAELLVTYQDVTVPYPLDSAEILLDETVLNAEDGTQNQFVYNLPASTTAKFLSEQFPVASFSDADVELINSKLEQALASGQKQSRVTISDDSLAIQQETVAEAAFTHSIASKDAFVIAEALNGIVVEPGATFSFLDFIAEIELSNITDAELSQMASSIYSAVLQTNLLINERSIGATAPKSVPLGHEAAINRQLGVDFVFTNPNASSFTLGMSLDSSTIGATLSGYPLVYDYQITAGKEQKVEPRLIKQYSAFVTSGKVVEEVGRNGLRLNVIRTILADGKELEVETVSTDFYPPVHIVEVYPLTVTAEAPAAGSTPKPGEPGFVDANGDGVHDGTSTGTTTPKPGEPGFIDANGDGVHDGTPVVPQPGEPGFTDTNGDGVHDGTPVAPQPGEPGFTDVDGDGVHDGVVVTPQPGWPGYTDTDGDGVHDGDTDEEEKDPTIDKGGNRINP